jgi:hypothetical protein
MCKVMVVAGQRSADEVRAHLADQHGIWVDDRSISLQSLVSAREPCDDAGLRRLVGAVMATPPDRERPPWVMEVVPLDGGRTGLVWRIDHPLADGVTAMRMARELLLEPAADQPRPELARYELPVELERPAGSSRAVAFVDAPLERLRHIGLADGDVRRWLKRHAELWGRSVRGFTLHITQVAGPSGPQCVLGAPLLGLHALAEIAHRQVLRVAVVSVAERISFGLCADPDTIDGLDRIAYAISRDIGGIRARGELSALSRL